MINYYQGQNIFPHATLKTQDARLLILFSYFILFNYYSTEKLECTKCVLKQILIMCPYYVSFNKYLMSRVLQITKE